ncbi:TIGR04211 family SH3 domain-containing protein [Corallincola luteus]|uniref:TIGR04211 family SH3 domain-containing protein n=1 Tax=Corallincola luteus TaxID=1775177 RepID=A0ABY2ANW1_9GAMM|nr:TIGR04211 family SH3 domain-containing protein [Corallincola luteus]TCI04890.1 TIGR04211 family SH3 domain-containing protein [Corallincola luteus]
MKKLLVSLALLLPTFIAQAADGGFRYVSDELTIFMHTGPSTQYRIIGTITAGSRVKVEQAQSDTDYIKVTDPKGKTGWVDKKLLMTQASLQYRMPQLEEQLATLQMELQARNEELAALKQNLRGLQEQSEILIEERDETLSANQRLTTELDTLDESTQMEWFWRGGIVLGAGILLGIIIPFLPRRKKQQDQWM